MSIEKRQAPQEKLSDEEQGKTEREESEKTPEQPKVDLPKGLTADTSEAWYSYNEATDWAEALGLDEEWLGENVTVEANGDVTVTGDIDVSAFAEAVSAKRDLTEKPWTEKDWEGDMTRIIISSDYYSGGDRGQIRAAESSVDFLPENLRKLNGDLIIDNLPGVAQIGKLPEIINGNLEIGGGAANRVVEWPKQISGDLELGGTSIKKIGQAEIVVGGDVNMSHSKLEDLSELSITIGGDLDLRDVNITQMPEKMIVAGQIFVDNSNLRRKLEASGYNVLDTAATQEL